MKKILIATGGSGGHVIPSLSIYDHLKDYFEITMSPKCRLEPKELKKITNDNIGNILYFCPGVIVEGLP